MDLKIKNIRSKVEVNWQWPTQIGFLKELVEDDILNKINSFYYLKSLSHTFIISRIRNEANILVLNGSFKDILKTASSLSFQVKTDLLVIFSNKHERIPHDQKKLSKIFRTIAFNSLLIVKKPDEHSIYYWLDWLVAELSHNNSIDEAIKNIGWSGLLALTPKLKRESKVDIVFDKLLIDIEKLKSLKNYDFDEVFSEKIQERIRDFSGLKGDIFDKRPKKILTDVRKKKKRFSYNREQEESSVIRDISVAHSANVSDMMEMAEAMEDSSREEAEKPSENLNPKGATDHKTKETSVRRLQCVFKDETSKPQHHALLITKAYNLIVKIDVPDPVFMQGGEVSSDDVDVQPGKKERVDILLRYDDMLEQQHIMLPDSGSSELADFSVYRQRSGECVFEIFAFHKNRLFQHLETSAFFCKQTEEFPETPRMKIVMTNMPRADLSDFKLKEEYGLSLVFTDGLPIIAEELTIREIKNESHINNFNDELRKIMEAYVKSKNPDADKLILSLAKLGSLFYVNIFKRKGDFDKPIQIISDSTNHFPLEFIYTEKLSRKTNKICSKASEALIEGKCMGCNKDEMKYICPFGFLSLRTVIERHRVGENVNLLETKEIGLKSDVSLNREAIPILNKTVYGTSEKVEKVISGMRSRIGDKLTSFSNEAHEVSNWDDWLKAIESDPDSLVIVGHVEPPKGSTTEQLELGNDLMEKVFIDESFLLSKNSKAHPILVLIGCSTQNVNMSFMDFTQHFKNSGAAIVISTFTKIRGSQAGPLVEKLFEVLHSYKGKEIRFGEAMLRLRQLLFAEGIYVSMAMVSHGDADWKLKI